MLKKKYIALTLSLLTINNLLNAEDITENTNNTDIEKCGCGAKPKPTPNPITNPKKTAEDIDIKTDIEKCGCAAKPKPTAKPIITPKKNAEDIDIKTDIEKCGCAAKPKPTPKPIITPKKNIIETTKSVTTKNIDTKSSEPVIHLESNEQFESLVINNSGPVIVKFFGTWCPPCKALAPIFKQAATEFKNKVTFVEIDVDKFESLCDKWNVASYPTLLFFKDGKKICSQSGSMRAEQLRQKINSSFKFTN